MPWGRAISFLPPFLPTLINKITLMGAGGRLNPISTGLKIQIRKYSSAQLQGITCTRMSWDRVSQVQ